MPTETKFQAAMVTAAAWTLMKLKMSPVTEGAKTKQVRSMVLKIEFMFDRRLRSSSAMTTIQSFSTTTFSPIDARSATLAIIITRVGTIHLGISG